MSSFPSKPLAGRAKKLAAKSGRRVKRPQTAAEHEWTMPQRQLLELIGRGMSTAKAANALLDELSPDKSKALDIRKREARKKARVWARTLWFRDALWNRTLEVTDLESGNVMRAMVQAAKKGRVDAAKLALAVAGRHSEHGDRGGDVNVQVVFAQMPRPDRAIELPPGDVEEL